MYYGIYLSYFSILFNLFIQRLPFIIEFDGVKDRKYSLKIDAYTCTQIRVIGEIKLKGLIYFYMCQCLTSLITAKSLRNFDSLHIMALIGLSLSLLSLSLIFIMIFIKENGV